MITKIVRYLISWVDSRLKIIDIWVYSHFIEYPRCIKIVLYFLFSIVHLVVLSPLHGVILLVLNTVYVLYHNKYKTAFIIWGSFLFIWYLVFTACLIGYEGPILITPNFFSDEDSEARRLFLFLHDSYLSSLFIESYVNLERFCRDTLVVLVIFSYVTNVTIYVPSLLETTLIFFNVIFFILYIIKIIFGR